MESQKKIFEIENNFIQSKISNDAILDLLKNLKTTEIIFDNDTFFSISRILLDLSNNMQNRFNDLYRIIQENNK